MMGTCAYPGCGRGFERKRSDARYCSDTCRATASKDRARARRDGGRRGRAAPKVAPVGADETDALTERLAAMEERLAAAEAGVTRAEADRAGWKKVRDQLQAALARVDGGGPASAEQIAAAVRAAVTPKLVKLAKRLDAVEAEQTAVRGEMEKLSAHSSAPDAEGLMTVGKAVGKLSARVSAIERDLRAFSKGVVEAVEETE